jgi:Tol biopolymer transport system component
VRVLWLLVLTVGCGRIDFAILQDASDAPPDAFVQFGNAALIAELDSPSVEDDPTLRGDELEVYFDSEAAGGMGMGDLYVASRASKTDPFGAWTNLSGLNTAADESTPELSHDGLTLTFQSDRPGGCGASDLYITTRSSFTAPWSAPTLIAELCTAGDEGGAVMSADGLHLAFAYDAGANIKRAIFTSDRASTTDPWSSPVPESQLDLTGTLTIGEPFLDAAGTTMYFAAGVFAFNYPDHDLYVATRPTPFDRFGPPTKLDVSAPNEADLDPWVSPDGQHLYFATHRTGNWQIYVATR